MSGARVFFGHRTAGKVRILEVWTYEDATRFPWTFLARNLPTVADIGLRKLVKLLTRIEAGSDAKGVGREAVEEWLAAPKAFGMRGGPGTDVLKEVSSVNESYPIGLILDADDNVADVFRPGVEATERFPGPGEVAAYLPSDAHQLVVRLKPRELRNVGLYLAETLDGRQAPLPDRYFWEHALLREEDESVLDVTAQDQAPPAPSPEQLAIEDAVLNDDPRTLRFLLDDGLDADLVLSWRAHGWRPVTLAARQGSTECLALLLDRGVEVGPDEIERAAENGHAEVVRLILEHRPGLRPKPRRRFFPGDGLAEHDAFVTPPDFESSDPGQPSPAG